MPREEDAPGPEDERVPSVDERLLELSLQLEGSAEGAAGGFGHLDPKLTKAALEIADLLARARDNVCWRCDATDATTRVGLCGSCYDTLMLGE